MDIKKVLHDAIEFIEGTASFIPTDYDHIGIDALDQCKQAIEWLDKQEPVAWSWDNDGVIEYSTDIYAKEYYEKQYGVKTTPLYLHPLESKESKPLSEDEICEIASDILVKKGLSSYEFARAIEAKIRGGK